jgi:hypothetical protein
VVAEPGVARLADAGVAGVCLIQRISSMLPNSSSMAVMAQARSASAA